MIHRSPMFPIICMVILLCGGCVAKSDYLQKQAEADTLSRNNAAMAAENAGLRDQVERANADREKLTAEMNDLNARLTAKTAEIAKALLEKTTAIAEMTRVIDELNNKTLELEGDKLMLQESIDLLRKSKEELTSRNADLERQKQMLQESVALLRKNKEELTSTNVDLENQKQMLQESIALLKKTKEEEVRTVSKTYEDLLSEMKEEIEQGQIAITELKGKLTMDVVDRILFDSGRAEVKPEGLVVLKRVVGILKTVKDKTIRVEGHTDNVPIGGILAKRYPTNWELSAARAINVTRYLEKEGLDPTLLSAAAFGEHQPVDDNEIPEGRAKNRRIAIILLPKEEPDSQETP